jgi:hypothetical protein
VEPFKRQQTKAWSFIDNYAEPLNSLIICDPYLINADGPNDNLYNILEGFLSGSIEGDVDVTFITTSKNFKIGDETWDQANQRFLKHWEQQKMRLRNRLGDNLNFSVVLYKGAELHDRFLITNNLMVYSGFSFNSLIDHQTAAPKKQTSWMIVRHAKMQDSNIPNGEKTHFHTAVGFIEDINRWIKNGKAEVFTDTETLYCNRLLTDHDVRSRA